MLGRDVIEFRLSPKHDPDGSRVRQLITAHYDCERARALRDALAHALALASLLLAPCAVWPDRLLPPLRVSVLVVWAACAVALTIAAAFEWRCHRKRSLRLSELGEGATMPR